MPSVVGTLVTREEGRKTDDLTTHLGGHGSGRVPLTDFCRFPGGRRTVVRTSGRARDLFLTLREGRSRRLSRLGWVCVRGGW